MRLFFLLFGMCTHCFAECFHTSIDYLLMKMEQEEIVFATTLTGTSQDKREEDLRFPFSFQSGFRLCLGYEIPSTCCVVKSSWDHLYSSAHGTKELGTTLIPTFGNSLSLPPDTLPNQRIDASWKGSFNQLDLYLDTKQLGFNLLLGLRIASIHQKIGSDFFRSGTLSNTHYDARQQHFLHTRFDGVGPLSGFEIRWTLLPHLQLFGSLKGSLLYSQSALHLQAIDIQAVNLLPTQSNYTENTYQRGIKTALDFGLGVEYAFCYQGFPICLHTAWEHHLWPKQNLFKPLTNGDFCTYGWSLGLDFLF